MVEDELDPLITRCPNCSTRFRVTENQLAVAGGQVRCGVCLNVFLGADYLMFDDEPGFATGTEADAALDELLDELSGTEAATVPAAEDAAGMEPFTAPRQVYGGYEDDVDEDVEPPELNLERPPPPVDEVLTEPDDVETQEVPAAGPGAAEELPETPSEETAPEEAPPLEASTRIVESDAEPAEEEPVSQASSEALPARVATPEAGDEEIELVEQDGYDAETSGGGFEWFDDPDPAPETVQARAGQEAAAAAVQQRIRSEQGSRVSFSPEPRRWWVIGVGVVLLLALAAQVFYFQLPTWSLDPGLRPLYERFCEATGCDLPEMRDLGAMRTRNLVVRSHPDVSNALVVDAVIVNQAAFAQPFPDLELKFTAVGGGLVAGRRFAPAEYLAGGELAATGLMPANTPVQVSLEIEDPGPAAVNYTLSFRESN